MSVRLPPRGRLRPTGRVDYIERYYRGWLGVPLRRRLRWVCDALPRGRCDSLLEIGYGSGVFFYEAARHAEHVLGVDVHPWAKDVRRSCSVDGVNRALASAERRRAGVRIKRRPRPRPLPRAVAPYELVVIELPSNRPDRRSRSRMDNAPPGAGVQRAS